MANSIKIKEGKTYLVTGGSGFLGSPLVKRILDQGGKARVMARGEGKLILLKEEHPQIEIYPGDVSDPFEVRQAMVGITGVFHLAASKHVGLAEKFVRENIKTNTIGSLNILESSLSEKPEFVVGISTDKAAQVSGVYGATKLLMERLFAQYEGLNKQTQYRIVRYGNVLYSTGSVLCKWKRLIQEGKEVTITDRTATRFFWTVEQAVNLIFQCLQQACDSKPFCPDMKSMSMGDLLEAMVLKYSFGQEIPIKIIGLQKGENLHEKVLDEGPNSSESEKFTVKEIMRLI
tara:strand:+ start:3009 stop:3875 length:867 start_codon:yes stop_codon:yes gene_type:complete